MSNADIIAEHYAASDAATSTACWRRWPTM